MKELIAGFITKSYEAVIIFLAAFLLLVLIGLGVQTWRASHWKEKFAAADVACIERINKVNQAYQDALDTWKAKVFIVENELEAERNNIKIQFRDIKHETEKVITERVYSECKLTDDGMRIAEAARIAANSSQPP